MPSRPEEKDQEKKTAPQMSTPDRAALEAVRKLHEEKGLASPEKLRSALHSDDPLEREKAAGELKEAQKKPPVLGGP